MRIRKAFFKFITVYTIYKALFTKYNDTVYWGHNYSYCRHYHCRFSADVATWSLMETHSRTKAKVSHHFCNDCRWYLLLTAFVYLSLLVKATYRRPNTWHQTNCAIACTEDACLNRAWTLLLRGLNTGLCQKILYSVLTQHFTHGHWKPETYGSVPSCK